MNDDHTAAGNAVTTAMYKVYYTMPRPQVSIYRQTEVPRYTQGIYSTGRMFSDE